MTQGSSSSPEVESLKSLVATLQAQLQRARERVRALESNLPAAAAAPAAELEALSEALAVAQMQQISALSEARRLQDEVGQLRASDTLLRGRLLESEREARSLLSQIRGGSAADGDGDGDAAAAAWQSKAHRLSARLKRCKVGSGCVAACTAAAHLTRKPGRAGPPDGAQQYAEVEAERGCVAERKSLCFSSPPTRPLLCRAAMDSIATSGRSAPDQDAAVWRWVHAREDGTALRCRLQLTPSPFRSASPRSQERGGSAAAALASDDSLDGFAAGSDARLASLEHALTTVLQVIVVVVGGGGFDNRCHQSSCRLHTSVQIWSCCDCAPAETGAY